MPFALLDGLDTIITRGAEYLSSSDLDLIRRAYEFTLHSFQRAHQVRLSGEPAIIHPIAVAETLVDWRMDGASIAAGLLHDVIEDTPVSAFQLHATFKDEVTFLVEGMTKLRRFDIKAVADDATSYHYQIFLTSASDIRVAIIKLADRLHNMRTLQFLPAQKRAKNCVETQKIFIPLARFLGMKAVKDDYEDISLKFLDEKEFERAKKAFDKSKEDEKEFFGRVVERLEEKLRLSSISARVEYRTYNLAHYHDECLDNPPSGEKLSGFITITTQGELECYSTLGAAHSLFEPVAGGFHDTITFPTADLKRWIETSVHDAGSRFKVRILSEEMAHVNNLGIIPYLVAPSELERTDFLQNRLKEIHDILHEMKSRSEPVTVDYITSDLFRNEIFVISGSQERISLPPNATVLDYAYRVDEEAANHFKSAVVNTRTVGINHALQSCDKVEINSGAAVTPTVEWLRHVQTRHAKDCIKKALSAQTREQARAVGRELLTSAVNSIGLVHSGQPHELENLIQPVAEFLGIKSLDEFHEYIGFGEIGIDEAIKALRKQRKRSAMLAANERLPIILSHPVFSREYPVSVLQAEKPLHGQVHLCEDCTPIPGDEIELRISGKKITVHETACRHTGGKKFPWSKKTSAGWGAVNGTLFPVRLRLKLFSRSETYGDIHKAIAEKGARFVTMQSGAETSDGLEMLEIIIGVEDRSMAQAVETAILSLRDVVVVTRI